MLFQLRSLGCAILLLMIFGTTSNIPSSLTVLQSGMLPVNQGDVAMVFYATVQNTGTNPQTVELNMVKCCLSMVDGSVDCSMKLQNGFPVKMLPTKMYNLTTYFVNKNLFGRNGECELRVVCVSSNKPLAEVRIQFNTNLSDPNLFQTIYMSMGGSSEGAFRKCETQDQDPLTNCQLGECILDYSGSRSFYNKKKQMCEVTPECSDEKKMMLSPVTNLCRDQYPSSPVIKSLTKDMKEGINDTDSALQHVMPMAADAVKVVCVNGKMDSKGVCQCDENWLSEEFDPKKVDPEKTPYYMCNIRSPDGEVGDRTISTGNAFTVLMILVVILFPCCTGIGIMLMYLYKRKYSKRKSFESISKDLSGGREGPDKSEEMINEIMSRREVKKSSTSRRSYNGQDSTTRSVNNNEPHSRHNSAPSLPYSSISNQSTSVRPRGTQSLTISNANNHSPTGSHFTSRHAISQPKNYRQETTTELHGFEEIPLIDLENENNSSNNALRSRSTPMMNMETYTPELVAVSSSNHEHSSKASFYTSQTKNPEKVLFTPVSSHQPSNIHLEGSETDVRASVKEKQELWAKFLQNISENRPIRQHSEFGFQDNLRQSQQAYHARSVPMMSSTNNNFQQDDDNPDDEPANAFSDTRTYTVFRTEQESIASISPNDFRDAHRSSHHKVDINEVENTLMDAMKSKNRLNIMETRHKVGMPLTVAERIAVSSFPREGYIVTSLSEESNELHSESIDSIHLLRKQKSESSAESASSLQSSSTDISDILVGSPIGGNKFWVQQFNCFAEDQPDDASSVNLSQLADPTPYQITSTLKETLRASASKLNNSLNKALPLDIPQQNNSGYPDSYNPFLGDTGNDDDTNDQQPPSSPLTAENVNLNNR